MKNRRDGRGGATVRRGGRRGAPAYWNSASQAMIAPAMPGEI